MKAPWEIVKGDGPVIVTAIHDGDEVRDQIKDKLKVSDIQRMREEDPFTGRWTEICDTRIIVNRSRFEFDLNRPREKAVYIKPEDAWGIEVWKAKPSAEIIEESLDLYDKFYSEVSELLKEKAEKCERFVVLDIHSYNYRRKGADKQENPPSLNPEVNIGTGTVDKNLWSELVERFITDLRKFDYNGRHLDVRENVKFRGGNFSQWINREFAGKGVSIAVEFKKFFMNEWTGKPDTRQVDAIKDLLRSTIPNLI